MKKLIIEKFTKTRDKNKSLNRIYLIGSEFFKTKFKEKSKFSYNIDFENRTVTISSNQDTFNHGTGTVCSKKIKGESIPLLDIQNKSITKVFDGVNKCKVEIFEEEIIITPEYKDNTYSTKNKLCSGFSKVVNIFSRKKRHLSYSVTSKQLDVVLKKVSGEENNIQQLSMFDLGYSITDTIYDKSIDISPSNLRGSTLDKAVVLSTLLSEFKYLELFSGSGIGGMDLDAYGCKNVGYSEVDSYAIKNYEANFPGRINFGDITSIDEKKLPKFDFLIFGSPCQNLSSMKKISDDSIDTKGVEGSKSKLFFDATRILNYCKPKWFIFENVRGLLTVNNGDDWSIVKNELSKNYNIKYEVLNSSDYGIPQTRRRIYVIGQLKELGDFNFSFPKSQPLEISVQDLLDNVVPDKYFLTEKMAATVLSTGTKGWYAKPETDLKVARTLTATMHKMHRSSQDNYYHANVSPIGNTNLRRLTPREAARLQGLDDSYKIVVSDTQAYKLMGNAMNLATLKAIVKKLALYIKGSFGINNTALLY